jgi:hypothetical protein
VVQDHDGCSSSELPLLERKLCEMERKRSEEASLWVRFTHIKDIAHRIWQPVRLRWYTDHGPEHSERIVRLIGQIVQPLYDDLEAPFSRYELFVLLVACYLHDIGMQDLRLDGKSSDELGPKDYEEIRRQHPERSAEIIIKQTLHLEGQDFSLGLERDQLLRAIALVSKAHGTEFFDEAIVHLQSAPIWPSVGEKIRGDVLAALLMMGDELDLHQSRVTSLFDPYTARFEEFPPVSLLHIHKHHYITNIQVADGNIKRQRLIKLGFTFPPNSDQYADRLTAWVVNKLVEQCEKTQPYLRMLGLMWESSISVDRRLDDLGIQNPLPDKAIQHLLEKAKSQRILPGIASQVINTTIFPADLAEQIKILPGIASQVIDTAQTSGTPPPTDRDHKLDKSFAEEKDPVVRWLKRLGFSAVHPFPFASERAESDPLLEGCFWPVLSFDDLMLDRHIIVCGRPGTGKTSYRTRFRDGVEDNKVFVVKVTDFHEVTTQIVGAASEQTPPTRIDNSKLHQILVAHFDDSEFRNLCFDLGVDYDGLGGASKSDKARELVGYFDRRGRIAELVSVCHCLRPNAAWQNVLPQQLLDESRSTLSTTKNSITLLERHIHEILKSGVGALLKVICKGKRFAEIYHGLSEIRRNRLLRYIYDYVESGDRQKSLDDGLVERGLPSVGELRIHGSEEQDVLVRFAGEVVALDQDSASLPRLAGNPSRLLNEFREILGWLGFENVVILYDNLDGFGESPQDISRLLAPLLNARTLFDSLEHIYFKFFLPVGLSDTLVKCWAVQSGSIQWLSELDWKPDQLGELYRLRLKAATDGRYYSLTPIAEPSFSDIDGRLIKAASTPRELWRLGRLLLEAHLQNHGDSEEYLLSERDLADALRRFADFSLGRLLG